MNAADVMANVVAELVDQIEAGAGTWAMPWRTLPTGIPTNAATGVTYSGGNVIALTLAAARRGWPNRWATYKQWQALGAQVRKGQAGTYGIRWNVKPGETITEDDPDTGEPVTLQTADRVTWAKPFVVFNTHQVDGDPHPPTPSRVDPLERDQDADAFFAAIPARVRWGAGGPCYRTATDDVLMPDFDAFHTTADAYSTLAHELGHWTGHRTRLARTYGRRFGDHTYTAEELVAELSAAFTCALVGIDTVARTDHAAYLAHWCQMLRTRPAVLWSVASKAQAATDYLAGYSQQHAAPNLEPCANPQVCPPPGYSPSANSPGALTRS